MATFCKKCGNKVPTGLDRCPYCGRKVDSGNDTTRQGADIKKIVIAGAAVLVVAAIGSSLLKNPVKPPAPVSPTPTTAAAESESLETLAAMETSGDTSAEVDHSAEVQLLQEQYNAYIADYQNGLVESDSLDNGFAYYQDGQLRGVDVNADSSTIYNREYYYRDGELYIAILRNPGSGQEDDIYYSNGEIIRWRDSAGNIHDDLSSAPDTVTTLNEYVQEGYDLYYRYEDRSSASETIAAKTPETPAPTEAPTTPAVNVSSDGFIFPDSDSRYLSASELSSLSDWELRIARNELYARHGRKFKDTELQNYFNGCSWYTPSIDPDSFDDEVIFNKYEIANRDLIRGYEKSRSGADSGVDFSVVNVSSPDISRYTDMSNYTSVTSRDGKFSFACPKDLFNIEVTSDSACYYYYRDASDTLQYALMVSRIDDPGDPLDRAKNRYREYRGYFSGTYFDRDPQEINSEGSSRGLIGGYYDSSRSRGAYVIIRNDGSSTYIMEFDYYCPYPDDAHSAERYMEDYLYRCCSFSGSSYQPRSYKLFQKEDMGKKK